ncbi:hypothetical protein [Streptomyces sp. NPDC059743]|uniref:hypothetical protein n=1 Tax=Streptomyces sp. NPDC059743 TaxID=3346928 RepID=UPI00365101F6
MEPLPFPHDLLQAQIAWHRAYAALADDPVGAHTTAQRRRLLRLSVRIFWHPYWSDPAGPARREELRRQVRALESAAGA